jgi:hypothetical protein
MAGKILTYLNAKVRKDLIYDKNFNSLIFLKDIDECEYSSAVCNHTNSICINTRGSYQCVCNAGFSKGEDDSACYDNDECLITKDICENYIYTECINGPGTYDCKCINGFSRNLNQTCEGIFYFL